MGTSCLSTIPKENEDINTENGSNGSIQKLKDESSASPSKPEDIHRKESNHYKNMNSLDSIDEFSPIQIDQYDNNYDDNNYNNNQHVLTHQALREHDMACSMGIDSMSLSSISIDIGDDDRLKQIGNQLISMNIGHPSNNNEQEKQQQHKLNDIKLNELQIPTHIKDEKNNNTTKYKQYKLRQDTNQCNKTKSITNNNEMDEIIGNRTHSTNTSITLSETPIPNDCHIINYNNNKPKYQRINSDSHQLHQLHHQQYPHKNHRNNNIFRQNEDEQNIENEADEVDESEDDLNFPDIFYFNNINNQ